MKVTRRRQNDKKEKGRGKVQWLAYANQRSGLREGRGGKEGGKKEENRGRKKEEREGKERGKIE